MRNVVKVIAFVVSWNFSHSVADPCPDRKPDQYGRMPTISCAVYHSHTETETRYKEFTDEKEARKFIKEGEDQYPKTGEYQIMTPAGFLSNFKLFKQVQ